MKRQIVLLTFAVAMLVTLAYADPAKDLQSSVLVIVANGWGPGHTPIYDRIGGTLQSDGTLSFTTRIQFPGEQWDDIAGTVKDRHIVFTRTRSGSFVQTYNGWFFQKSYQKFGEMAGTFSDDGVNQYGWYGWLESPAPK